ncbi:MAG: SEC59/DGK1/VTE5 family protein [Ignavibacteriaceae bacterium]|nr:SEC59/DGK1/VTE5 family protein [Ignavibacteriaceae bacterium]
MNQIDNGSIKYKDELVRKLIHLCSLSIPIIYYYISTPAAVTILSVLTLFAITLDLSRYYFPKFGKFFYKYFGFILRKHEVDNVKKNLNGATYVLISALFCVIIFPKVFFVTAFTILIISDTAAALIGRKFGKHKLLAKSFEGTLTFFVSASVVILFTPKLTGNPTELLIGIIAAAVGAIVENISFGWADDNLTIPLSVGFSMWGMYLLLMPDISLILPNVPR